MSMDDLTMQGYLGNQIGSQLLNSNQLSDIQRAQQEAYMRQIIAQQNAVLVSPGQWQQCPQRAVQPPQPTDDHLLVLLTEE